MRLAWIAVCLALALPASGCRAATDDDVAQLRAELLEIRAEQRQLRDELHALGGARVAGRPVSDVAAGSAASIGRPGDGSTAPPIVSPGGQASSTGEAAAPSPTAPGAASTIEVPIQTDPPGAEVFLGEQRTSAGVTPFVLTTPRDVEVHLRFEKDGYRPHLLNLRPAPGVSLSVPLARKGR